MLSRHDWNPHALIAAVIAPRHLTEGMTDNQHTDPQCLRKVHRGCFGLSVATSLEGLSKAATGYCTDAGSQICRRLPSARSIPHILLLLTCTHDKACRFKCLHVMSALMQSSVGSSAVAPRSTRRFAARNAERLRANILNEPRRSRGLPVCANARQQVHLSDLVQG